jgi:hypothetical protein
MEPIFTMSAYRVISSATELPRNTLFTAVNTYPIKDGELVLFSIDGRLTIGRWRRNIAGLDWIKQPNRWIPIIGKAAIVAVGVIILLTAVRR